MGQDTKIEWAHHTFNPWWGCERVSAGCAHCYAAALATRLGQGGLWGGERKPMKESYWEQPRKWDALAAAAGERHRVFCASMADVFEDRDELIPWRDRLLVMIGKTPHLDWLLLTKRPENIPHVCGVNWPRNVWIGATVESAEVAEERVSALLRVNAPVRFLSCEPLLGDVSGALRGVIEGRKIDWVICGGESGPGARPMKAEWAWSLMTLCKNNHVPFFFKQWGEHDWTGARVGKAAAGRVCGGRVFDEVPVVS